MSSISHVVLDNQETSLKTSKLALLFGGQSSEKHVSVASAAFLHSHLPEALLWFWDETGTLFEVAAEDLQLHNHVFIQRFNPLPHTFFASNIKDALQRAKQEDITLIIALHGGDGENGILAQLCENLGVAFTGSGSVASHLAIDKIETKRILASAHITVLPHVHVKDVVHEYDTCLSWIREYGGMIIKPIADGSSTGLFKVCEKSQFDEIISVIDHKQFFIEPLLTGVECSVGVLERLNQESYALEPIEIRLPEGQLFDYHSKYIGSKVIELCPASFSSAINEKLKTLALQAHQLIGLCGYSRSDFIVTDKACFFLEVNTLPGLSEKSLFPQELAVDGISVRTFLIEQAEIARKNRIKLNQSV